VFRPARVDAPIGRLHPMLYYAMATFYVVTCLVLLLVVLLQQGKGGDMAAAFGGSGSQTAFGARAGATLLTRVTAVCAALFMLGALALAVIGQRGPGSVVGDAPTPAPAPASQSAPATPGPAQSAPAQPAPAEQPK
jgi:preprotein translocase subunit SecG